MKWKREFLRETVESRVRVLEDRERGTILTFRPIQPSYRVALNVDLFMVATSNSYDSTLAYANIPCRWYRLR